MLRTAWLRENLETHLGPGSAPRIGIGLADTGAPAEGLWPAERAATTCMVDKRLREFAAGRAAARRAMSDLGLEPAGVPMAANRAPVWPDGLTGSISHTDRHALSVLAFRCDMRAVGVDLEDAVPLAPDLWDIVLTGAETASVTDGIAAMRIFSAKEAVFKAQYPLTGRLLEFLDVGVVLSERGFAARIRPDLPDLPATLNGLSVLTDSFILSFVSFPEADAHCHDV